MEQNLMIVNKNMRLLVLVVCACVCFLSVPSWGIRGRSIFMPRPQGVDGGRWLINKSMIDLGQKECSHGGFVTVMPAYEQTFHAHDIARYSAGACQLNIAGSRVANRAQGAILADYFGLPTDFASTVFFRPKVRTGSINLYGYYNPFCTSSKTEDGASYCKMPGWKEHLFLKINAPIVFTSWSMHPCEQISAAGVNNYPAGYMSSQLINRSALPESFSQVLADSVVFGDMQSPLQFGKICCRSTHTTRLADIRTVLGYRFCDEMRYVVSGGLVVSIPTGNAVTSHLLFDPLLGNGKHWELGLELAGNGTLWESENESDSVVLYGQAQIGHLFKTRSRRSFDFVNNGCGSRYMLIEEIGRPVCDGLNFGTSPNTVAAENQYHAKLFPAINKTTLHVSTCISVQADVALACAYAHRDWTVTVGYNLWARTRERARCREKFPENCFALKGDSQIYGFTGVLPPALSFLGLNATQSKATLCGGQGVGSASGQFTNPNVDNAALVSFDCGDQSPFALLQTNDFAGTGITSPAGVNGSNQAILLTDADIDTCSGLAPSAVTHRLLVNSAYQFTSFHATESNVGLGASVELDQKVRGRKGAFSQWGIWLVIGCSF